MLHGLFMYVSVLLCCASIPPYFVSRMSSYLTSPSTPGFDLIDKVVPSVFTLDGVYGRLFHLSSAFALARLLLAFVCWVLFLSKYLEKVLASLHEVYDERFMSRFAVEESWRGGLRQSIKLCVCFVCKDTEGS